MRLAIYSFYDPDGVIDNYVLRILDSLLVVADRLVIVVNGVLASNEIFKFRKYSDEIIIRSNIGFDAYAYKYTLLDLFENNKLKGVSELILLNNTVYGPFFELGDYFEVMEAEDVDFWGFGKWTRGYSEELKCIIPDHVQSFFLVIKKKLLFSKVFYDYWEKLGGIDSYADAIEKFEVAFTKTFKKAGYRYTTWLDYKKVPYIERSGHDYRQHYFECVSDYQYPFLKRKDVSFPPNDNVRKMLDYVHDYCNIDIAILWDDYFRRNGKGGFLGTLKDFSNKFTNLYIYGHGIWGKGIAMLLDSYEIKDYTFVVSNNQKYDNEVERFEEICFSKNDGIIVGLNKEHTEEVRRDVLMNLPVENVMFIN